MNRKFYLDLAAAGKAFPIGVDLLLHEHADHEAILLDGRRLGAVVGEAARRYDTPLAIPYMDLRLEKDFLLEQAGLPAGRRETHCFDAPLPDQQAAALAAALNTHALSPRMQACCDAVRYIAGCPDLVPVGMCVGPFTLMTKLIENPIVPIYLMGGGLAAADDPLVALVEQMLELARTAVLRYMGAQLDAGARALLIIEPSINSIYISPRQLESAPELFERLAIANLRRIRDVLRARDADLILHDCGALTDAMVQEFGRLDPAILSLGSSRRLWEDARLTPKTTVLYGNLPSKHFYSDETITCAQVAELARELRRRMRAAEHPFILGTECDVLHVPGAAARIRAKVDAGMGAGGRGCGG